MNQFLGGAGIGASIAGGLQITRFVNGEVMNPQLNVTFFFVSLLQGLGMLLTSIQRRQQATNTGQAFSRYGPY